jgi:hypothetical protein
MDEETDDEEGNEIFVAEWVKRPRPKPISCSFLMPNGGRREEMRYTFDVSKCDRVFDLLLRGGVIRLTEGHIIANTDVLAKKTYCKCTIFILIPLTNAILFGGRYNRQSMAAD